MCIICNMPAPAGVDDATEFLHRFYRALQEMKDATRAMQRVAKFNRHYDRTHKKMVRITREWAKVEHEREVRIGVYSV